MNLMPSFRVQTPHHTYDAIVERGAILHAARPSDMAAQRGHRTPRVVDEPFDTGAAGFAAKRTIRNAGGGAT